jgi:hypothetical protein
MLKKSGSTATDTALGSGRLPKSQVERQRVAEVIGQDGSNLLTQIFDPTSPAWRSSLPAVELLRQIWVQNYYWQEDQLHWRDQNNIPPASTFINSPYDPEARLGKKRSTMWTGDIRSSERDL